MLTNLQDRVVIETFTSSTLINKNAIKAISNNSFNNINRNDYNFKKKVLFRKFCIDINFELREDLIYYVNFNVKDYVKLYILII